MRKSKIQAIVVAGVLIRKGKALILQRSDKEKILPGIWELPSGKKEFGENIEGSLIREFKEETGIDIKVSNPISVFDYKVEERNCIRETTQINFLVEPKNIKFSVRLAPEHQSYTWIAKEEIDNYKLTSSTKKVLLKAFDMFSL